MEIESSLGLGVAYVNVDSNEAYQVRGTIVLEVALAVVVSASVDLFVASGGIAGQLNILEGSLPYTLAVRPAGPTTCHTAALELYMLSGKEKKFGFFFFIFFPL